MMTNKEFYGDKLLVALIRASSCQLIHYYVFGENCTGNICKGCRFSSMENIENWLNAEHEELPRLKNGEGLKPGDLVMVRDCDGGCWVKRQFLFYHSGIFYCELVDSSIGDGEYVSWKQARLPEEDE